MNILLLNLEKNWRGGENQVFLLAHGLKDRGCKVHVAYPAVNKEAIARYQRVASVLALSSTRPLRLKNIIDLKNYCVANKIELINANSATSHALALYVKLLLPSIKVVVHRRVAFKIKENFFTKKKYRSSKVDSYVAISKAIAKILMDYGVAKEKIQTIESGISIPKQQVTKEEAKRTLAEKYGVDPTVPWIGNASALAKEKGIGDLLEICRKLKKNKAAFFCLIAGKGPLRQELEKALVVDELSTHVKFIGFTRDVPAFLRALDVFVMSSTNEGLGTILLEAALAETALVATNVGGIPEIVIDKKTGFLYQAGDTDDAFTKVQVLLNDAGLKKYVTEKALKHVTEKFSSESMVERNYQNYLRLLS